MLRLNNLKSPKGAHRNIKRIGRGQGSGQGKQAGRGHKGQKSRSGGGVRTGFEGGNLPLYMRLPKRGFKNAPFKVEYATINLDQLEAKFADEEVNRQNLIDKKLISGIDKRRPIKILGRGEIKKALVFVGIAKFSKSAQAAITSVGGTINSKEGC